MYWFVFKPLRWQNVLILVASYFFYGWWSWKFMILLAVSTFADYLYGFWVASPNRKKAQFFLWLSVINNLGILGVFKYYNFFALEFKEAFALIGFHTNPVLLKVAIPIGISFYTFHGMSYVFDIYRGKQKPVRNFVDYAVFVSFFPLLVAGPIERANHLLPQIQKKRFFNYAQAVAGCRLMLWGMFKKIVIADSLATIVDSIFNNYQHQSGLTLIIGAIAFSFQIYGDFSGYSDIAMGTAKLFGFELLSNFRFPYFSRDVAEFWRRWHISLSSWFRDYLYIPLGGSKEGKLKAVRNTFIIFLVSGFWHGASWNYIAWGFLHACGFLPLLLLQRNRRHASDVVAQYRKYPTGKELWQMASTFTFVTFAWVFFRAKDMFTAAGYLKGAITNYKHPKEALAYCNVFYYIIPLLLIDWWLRRDERNLSVPKRGKRIVYMVLALLVIFYFGKKTNFIYFQF
ncbi:MBOAT family O-acyltransferase [Niastella vici]|uniref:MBOAT family O-acyltransferase n=1 Tax=Niastella vici TaxID=1703345 RepID=UPI001FE62A60|nr:MBOAT family O-acyltransferase [Niastella vici]